ncbi:MAG TPA: DUF4352 domain-containing protein [Candidatus Limnocylindrales bacterium]|nr:DUF4352 domain-containing protein [Candidatus Limnocylindrales bacterium]
MTTPTVPKWRKRLRWIVLGGAGLFGLCCIGPFVTIRDNGQPSQPVGRNVAATSKIGTAVRDGKFEFVVRSFQCGVAQIGPAYADERAQGQFCLVSLTAKNIGDRPQIMSEGAQKGYGTNGAQYGTNSAAGLYANVANNRVWRTEINPGNEVTGTIVYDLPRGVELAQLELHDSLASAGVKVDLR